MICPRCSRTCENEAAFCGFCGTSLRADGTRLLKRIPSRGKVAGVCAGLAAYLKLDVTIIRLGWIVLSIVPGALIGGVLVYAAAWALMPEVSAAEAEPPATDRLFRADEDRKVAGVCGGFARYLHVDSNLVRLAFVVLSVYPGAIIGGLLVYVVAWVVMPLEPPTYYQPATVV
jgi:phage shock protein PspC (stress-responsive transcriptional regulator)